jgi:predicted deacetylase
MSQARFIIRWDDISPFQDGKKYRSLIDLFIKYSIPAVLGVIPENRDRTLAFGTRNETEYVDELRELEKAGWEIAQHGYRHLKNTDDGGILNLNQASEFAGRESDVQLADIEKGKNILHDYGFEPLTFIPPWHSYDQSTLTVLEQSGFKILSDGIFLFPRMTGSLLQLPQIFWSAPGRMKLVNRLGSVYTICLHPHSVTADEMKSMDRFFIEEKPQVVTAASLIGDASILTRPSVRKRLFELFFAHNFKRQD